MNKKVRIRPIIFTGLVLLFTLYVANKMQLHAMEFPLLTLLFALSSLVVAIVIFMENRHPSKTILWLLFLAVNPLIGLLFYSLFGVSYRKEKRFVTQGSKQLERYVAEEGDVGSEQLFRQLKKEYRTLYYLFQTISTRTMTHYTTSRVLIDGHATYKAMLDAIKQARKYIYLEYYILKDDGIGMEFQNELIQKQKEGVHVRILYDYVGSVGLSKAYIARFKEAGVAIVPFEKVRFSWFKNRVNFRNHRKITIIDGEIGFIGGLNIGDEYLGKDKKMGFWRDTHLLVEGRSVYDLESIFIEDWNHVTNEAAQVHPASVVRNAVEENGLMQIVSSGPNKQWKTIKQLMFSMITSAKESIYIATPYFIPDEDILTALKNAALSQIDVKILMPSYPDKKIVFYASRSYYEELMDSGVQVYLYEKGFLHSKIAIVDGQIATIGTTNMDVRSFELNFEVNAFLYQTHSVQELAQSFQRDLADASHVTPLAFQKRSKKERLLESFARLASPLL